MSCTTIGPNDCDVQIKINCDGKKSKKAKKDKVKCVDFNDCSLKFGDTGGVSVGTDPIDAYLAAFGITVSLVSVNIVGAPNAGQQRKLMIFDSSKPNQNVDTGDVDALTVDLDLGTPNESFGSPWTTTSPPTQDPPVDAGYPGVGAGGEAGQAGENRKARGNLLIVSKDNISAQPNDLGTGDVPANTVSVVTFVFDKNVHLMHLDFIDSDENENNNPLVKVQDMADNHLIGPASGSGQVIMPLGNNSYQRLSIDEACVKKLTVCFRGSGAISEICFKKDRSCTHTLNVCC
jgi:hypothetical protein